MNKHTQFSGIMRALFIPAVLAFSLVSSHPVSGQPPKPVIKYIFPAGGQRGKSVEVLVSGTGFQGANAVRVTGKGVSSKVVKVENPNTVRITVAIAPDAELGERDLRIISPAAGASNRFRFFVGELPEILEKEPNSLKSQAQLLESLPSVVNGQIFPADRDFFRFRAKSGQTLVFEVQARNILPYIADAVPGWLEASLTLYDASGKELVSTGRFHFNPDPVLIFNVPRDGEYLVEIRDLFYRGREDFLYRLSIGAFPYITHFFPLGGNRGSDVQLELHGANLPGHSMKLSLPGDASPLRWVSWSHNGLTSNALPFAVGDLKETRETEPNDALDTANAVEIPLTINGRIQQRGDADYFRFSAKQGQRLILEVQARRLGSPLDSILALFNSQGVLLAEQDDTDMGDPLLTHHADSRLDFTFPADGDYFLRIQDVQGGGGQAYAYRLHIAPLRPDFTLRIVPENPRLGEADTAFVTVKALRLDGFNDEIHLVVRNLPTGFVASKAIIPAGQGETRWTITAPAKVPVALWSPTIVGTASLGKETILREAVGAEDIMQAFTLRHDVPTREFLVTVLESADFALSTNIPATEVREVRRESQIPVVVKISRKGLDAEVAQAESARKIAEGNLAKLKEALAKAKTKPDKLVAEEKVAAATLDQAGKTLEAARQKAKQPIQIAADALPAGIACTPVSLAPDKSEVTVTLTVPAQAPVGLRHFFLITGTMGAGDTAVVHAAPAVPIVVLESIKVLAAAAAAKRQQANEAKKKLDDLVEKQQKPAEALLAKAAQAVTDATAAKGVSDKALAQAKEAVTRAQAAQEGAEKTAKEADARAQAVARDGKKSEAEKKKAAEEAAAQRKAAEVSKTVLAETQKKQQQAQTHADTTTKKLSEAEAQKKAAEQALAGVKNQVAAASKTHQDAEGAAKEAEMAAAKAKT